MVVVLPGALFDLLLQWVMQTASTISSSPNPTPTLYQWGKRNQEEPGEETEKMQRENQAEARIRMTREAHFSKKQWLCIFSSYPWPSLKGEL